MTIDLFGGGLVFGNELSLDVFSRRVEFIWSCVLRKTNGQKTALDLFLKEVLFVEEQNDRSVDEPLVVADRVEEAQTLVHAVGWLVLVQHLVVLGQSHAEYDRCHVLETMNPLFALGPLAADVKQTEVEIFKREIYFDDTWKQFQKYIYI